MTVDEVTGRVADRLGAREEIVDPFVAIIDRDRDSRSPEDLAGQFAGHTCTAIATADGVRWVVEQLSR